MKKLTLKNGVINRTKMKCNFNTRGGGIGNRLTVRDTKLRNLGMKLNGFCGAVGKLWVVRKK